MKFKLYREYGSLNSPPIFDAVEAGLKKLGHDLVSEGEDIPIIWSALWAGRMLGNQRIYKHRKSQNQPILIIEVGNLLRNQTWRISFNNINRDGIFANTDDLDRHRPTKLGLRLKELNYQRKPEILVAAQHGKSLQWENMPDMETWIKNTVQRIRQFSDRNIIIRPHPRFPLRLDIPKCQIETPRKLINSYDDFDIDYRYHCVINHNSGPAVQAAIEGVPVSCDRSSLAYEVSFPVEQIETPSIPDREDWFVKLCHTEWTATEISQGIPFDRLLKHIA
jgi:hypothetical protein